VREKKVNIRYGTLRRRDSRIGVALPVSCFSGKLKQLTGK